MMDPYFTALRVSLSILDENFPVISDINYILIGINIELYKEHNVEKEPNEKSSKLVSGC